jgi:streptogramin lyase
MAPAMSSTANATHARDQNARAIVRIAIPKRRRAMHGHYVSPATQSIAIALTTQGGSPVGYNADLTAATNPNCVGHAPEPLVCTITIQAPPGTYTASFATYSGPLGTNNAPTGLELSEHQSVPLPITLGQPNVLNVTLDGIPTSIALVPDASSSITGTTAAGFTLTKCATTAQNVTIAGVDAKGYTIIGSGMSAATLSSDSPTKLAVAAPASPSPNEFALTPVGTLTPATIPKPHSVVHLSATVTPPAGAGSRLSASINVTFNADLCGLITEFPLGSSAYPAGITVGADGNMWFAENQGNKIGRITTNGSITEFSTHLTAGSEPYAIVAGPTNALWFTESGGNRIGKITTAGAISETAVPTSASAPFGIASGPDGNLWFTEGATNKIGRMTPAGSFKEYAVVSGTDGLRDITAGADGNLWFANYGITNGFGGAGAFGRITTSGTITEFSTDAIFGDSPFGVAPGPDGDVWFTEQLSNAIARVAPDGTAVETQIPTYPTPQNIAEGPDGNMWFTEACFLTPAHINSIGRVTPTGVVTEFALPANSAAASVVAGPDGFLWFTDTFDRIGRLQ